MKRFFGRIEIRNECLHLTVKVEMYAYIFIYILSNGTLQKIGVIQALMSDPEVLILDEPLSGQDIDS